MLVLRGTGAGLEPALDLRQLCRAVISGTVARLSELSWRSHRLTDAPAGAPSVQGMGSSLLALCYRVNKRKPRYTVKCSGAPVTNRGLKPQLAVLPPGRVPEAGQAAWAVGGAASCAAYCSACGARSPRSDK